MDPPGRAVVRFKGPDGDVFMRQLVGDPVPDFMDEHHPMQIFFMHVHAFGMPGNALGIEGNLRARGWRVSAQQLFDIEEFGVLSRALFGDTARAFLLIFFQAPRPLEWVF